MAEKEKKLFEQEILADPERERENKEKEIKDLLFDINRCLNEWTIMEDKWITPEMYLPSKKEELEKIRKNKLRKNWFQFVTLTIEGAEEVLDENSYETLNKKLGELIKKVHSTQGKEGKMNRGLVEQGDNLLIELKDLLEKKF
ncbi:hypothetical protein KKA09_02500 [Patescibacteria group bacterium]|nr:hypothetical protein [Patescibacteria group bacterium]